MRLCRPTQHLRSVLSEGPHQVSGNYGIYSQLCFPKSTGKISDTTIQFLIHGAGADRTYWDFAPGYSYVDYAAEQGYTTFIYDHIVLGLSDHPDPIQVLQTELNVEVDHELIQHLRAGSIAGQAFKNVVGIGHSFGSIQTHAVNVQYPTDLDAAVLVGPLTGRTTARTSCEPYDVPPRPNRPSTQSPS